MCSDDGPAPADNDASSERLRDAGASSPADGCSGGLRGCDGSGDECEPDPTCLPVWLEGEYTLSAACAFGGVTTCIGMSSVDEELFVVRPELLCRPSMRPLPLTTSCELGARFCVVCAGIVINWSTCAVAGKSPPSFRSVSAATVFAA